RKQNCIKINYKTSSHVFFFAASFSAILVLPLLFVGQTWLFHHVIITQYGQHFFIHMCLSECAQ
ncbi:hypothetical protein ACJX0J_024964, partial [Zea mays]